MRAMSARGDFPRPTRSRSLLCAKQLLPTDNLVSKASQSSIIENPNIRAVVGTSHNSFVATIAHKKGQKPYIKTPIDQSSQQSLVHLYQPIISLITQSSWNQLRAQKQQHQDQLQQQENQQQQLQNKTLSYQRENKEIFSLDYYQSQVDSLNQLQPSTFPLTLASTIEKNKKSHQLQQGSITSRRSLSHSRSGLKEKINRSITDSCDNSRGGASSLQDSSNDINDKKILIDQSIEELSLPIQILQPKRSRQTFTLSTRQNKSREEIGNRIHTCSNSSFNCPTYNPEANASNSRGQLSFKRSVTMTKANSSSILVSDQVLPTPRVKESRASNIQPLINEGELIQSLNNELEISFLLAGVTGRQYGKGPACEQKQKECRQVLGQIKEQSLVQQQQSSLLLRAFKSHFLLNKLEKKRRKINQNSEQSDLNAPPSKQREVGTLRLNGSSFCIEKENLHSHKEFNNAALAYRDLKAENDSPDFSRVRKYYNLKYGDQLERLNNGDYISYSGHDGDTIYPWDLTEHTQATLKSEDQKRQTMYMEKIKVSQMTHSLQPWEEDKEEVGISLN